MALARKGSRSIAVGGTRYRWRIRSRPTYSQGLGWKPCTFAVEHANTPGAVLVVSTNQPHPSNWFGWESQPVLPKQVAQAIERALRDGWSPTTPGRPFRLDLSAGFTPLL